MQFLAKIVKDCESRGIFRTQQNMNTEYCSEYVSGSVNYFRRELNLRCLTGFWVRLWYKLVFSFGQTDCLITELKFRFLLFWWNIFHSSLHVNYRFPKRPLYHIAQSIAHSVIDYLFCFAYIIVCFHSYFSWICNHFRLLCFHLWTPRFYLESYVKVS